MQIRILGYKYTNVEWKAILSGSEAREMDTRQPLMQYKLHVSRGTGLSCVDE